MKISGLGVHMLGCPCVCVRVRVRLRLRVPVRECMGEREGSRWPSGHTLAHTCALAQLWLATAESAEWPPIPTTPQYSGTYATRESQSEILCLEEFRRKPGPNGGYYYNKYKRSGDYLARAEIRYKEDALLFWSRPCRYTYHIPSHPF